MIKLIYKDWDILHWRYGNITFLKRLWYKNIKNDGITKLTTPRHIWLYRCYCWKEFYHIVGKVNSCGCWRTYNRKLYWESLYNSAISKIIAHIKRRNILLSVNKEYLLDIIKKPCFYCWDIGSNTSANKSTFCKTLKHNGIDRIDSSKWYIQDNCVPCCKRCNWAKNELSVEDFKEHIKKIYIFMNLWW